MGGILALDISKRSTGWAIWQPGWDSPRYGHVQLGSEFTSDGGCCLKLHRFLADLYVMASFAHMFVEKPLTQVERGGNSNPANDIQLKLVGHAESFGEAYSLRTVQLIHLASWRRFFIGAMPRATKSAELKEYALQRCRQYGWKPRNSDEGDALGLLDYSLDLQGIVPPWRAGEVLRPMLSAGAAR